MRIFFLSSLRFSPGLHSDHCKKVVDVFLLQCLHCPLSRHDLHCCLQRALARWLAAWNLVRVRLEYAFFTFAKFLRALCGQMSQSVSQWVEGEKMYTTPVKGCNQIFIKFPLFYLFYRPCFILLTHLFLFMHFLHKSTFFVMLLRAAGYIWFWR